MSVGSQVLSTNAYEPNRNGLLSAVQYGNGGKVSYYYDEFDQLTCIRRDDSIINDYVYEYGANGQLAKITDNTDSTAVRVIRTDCDLANRPCQTELTLRNTWSGITTMVYRTRLKYNNLNNLVLFAEEVGGETHKSAYTYDRDNCVTGITYDDSEHSIGYDFDELGRLKTRTAVSGLFGGALISTYSYLGGGYGTNSTTPLISAISQNHIPFSYTYDNRGNITSETRGSLTTTYGYDTLGQLVRVNDPHENASWVFTYDRGGNITSKAKYAYTTGALGFAQTVIPYVYGDSNWKDKLTGYNGRMFSYDAIGNPLNDGIWSYEWQTGRQLKRMSANGTAVSFKYDHSGLRIEKVVEQDWYPVTTRYMLHGKLITHMTVDYTDWDEVAQQDVLHFFYDAQSRPAKVRFNGVIYTYIHNLQGDIVGILDASGALVVEYKYDVWGKLLSTTGSMSETLGKRNPFRYRGYVYDEETGLYYLRSRFYNPDLGRFINADALHYGNAFAYCRNSSVCRLDKNGFDSSAVSPQTYETIDSAAIAAAAEMYDTSMYTLLECFSIIYEVSSGSQIAYAYTDFVVAEPHEVPFEQYEAAKPEGKTVVAVVHSHLYGQDFSKEDHDFIMHHQVTLGMPNFVGYVITPSRTLLRWPAAQNEKTLNNRGATIIKKHIKTAFLTANQKLKLAERYREKWYNHVSGCDYSGADCKTTAWPHIRKFSLWERLRYILGIPN